MNSKLNKYISKFSNLVLFYIRNEYDEKYYRYCKNTTNYKNLHTIISAYYLGGNNVPDTAADVVQQIKYKL